MSRATPKMRNLAECLTAYETSRNSFPETNNPTFLAVHRLRPQLAALMGNIGFRALLSRALALATAEIPWLRAMHVKPDGTLERLDDLNTHLDPDELFEGRVVLLTQLLGLLFAFIGENLTLRLVSEVWPKLSLHDLDFGIGDKK